MDIMLLALSALLLGDPGEPPGDKPAPVEYNGSAGQLDVETPRMTEAEVDIDGRLDEAVWADAALLHSFTQYDPVEGISATQRTEALVFVTDEAVYFGIRAYDDAPDGVRATLAERDKFTRSDDYVRIVLDTFDDQRRAYAFVVNPFGIQGDGIWAEGGGGRGGGGGGGGFGQPIDNNPDFLWDSNGQLTELGCEAREPESQAVHHLTQHALATQDLHFGQKKTLTGT